MRLIDLAQLATCFALAALVCAAAGYGRRRNVRGAAKTQLDEALRVRHFGMGRGTVPAGHERSALLNSYAVLAPMLLRVGVLFAVVSAALWIAVVIV
jgi:hypothetical protein